MFAPKTAVSSSHPTRSHLPTVSKMNRRRFRSSPTPSSVSVASTTTNTSDSVTALKAKYTDYAMWLKTSARQNREPVFTNELLKHSLCQMGIDATQADQLVSTCSWYVYQFQKELDIEALQQHQQSVIGETKKYAAVSKKSIGKTQSTKSSRTTAAARDSSSESVSATSSVQKGSCRYESRQRTGRVDRLLRF